MELISAVFGLIGLFVYVTFSYIYVRIGGLPAFAAFLVISTLLGKRLGIL